jgi:hypothetical protein
MITQFLLHSVDEFDGNRTAPPIVRAPNRQALTFDAVNAVERGAWRHLLDFPSST